VIRDDGVRAETLEQVRSFALASLAGAREIGWIDSPVHGADGNREYLLGLERAS
jgi:23S rRNA (cytidine1920-2'-O)/16S rRNA (cytidine1409-2'-O)-methyltransferase